jgi:hypothetical protein
MKKRIIISIIILAIFIIFIGLSFMPKPTSIFYPHESPRPKFLEGTWNPSGEKFSYGVNTKTLHYSNACFDGCLSKRGSDNYEIYVYDINENSNKKVFEANGDWEFEYFNFAWKSDEKMIIGKQPDFEDNYIINSGKKERLLGKIECFELDLIRGEQNILPGKDCSELPKRARVSSTTAYIASSYDEFGQPNKGEPYYKIAPGKFLESYITFVNRENNITKLIAENKVTFEHPEWIVSESYIYENPKNYVDPYEQWPNRFT